MKAVKLFHQKIGLEHKQDKRIAVFEFVVWKVPVSAAYPEGIKFRAWLSDAGATLFGFDNHKPKGPHLHYRDTELGYVYRGLSELKEDVIAMIRKEGFKYED
jgi:hypothetical protein